MNKQATVLQGMVDNFRVRDSATTKTPNVNKDFGMVTEDYSSYTPSPYSSGHNDHFKY